MVMADETDKRIIASLLAVTLGWHLLLWPSPCSALNSFAFEPFPVEEDAFDIAETHPAMGTPIMSVQSLSDIVTSSL